MFFLNNFVENRKLETIQPVLRGCTLYEQEEKWKKVENQGGGNYLTQVCLKNGW